ncbi:hypothetical protein AVEN_224038-1 [Araneus ventricosus]|uniref:Mos1 transposase HTH domain-containing protein n=1 Tax=Araneus ventricosus TaxID=182803 RepID=A0A4Y2J3C7_ARAVE|nr:hypothetical protein AVEN_224038-1 [Araneus ventricosus]
MEVRAVMCYEWARGTSILDIHRRLQSVYGDDVMSHQMAGRSCSMFSGRRQTWIWKDAQIGLHLPHSATHPLRSSASQYGKKTCSQNVDANGSPFLFQD